MSVSGRNGGHPRQKFPAHPRRCGRWLLHCRELRGFNGRIEGAKEELRKVWRQYWGQEEGERTRGRLDQVLREQRVQGAQAGRYVEYEIEGETLRVRRRGFECREKKQFGKRVLFTNRMGMRAEEMIELDGERRKVEEVFKELVNAVLK